MHHFITSAALVASAALSLAAPTQIVGRSTFSVKQVAVSRAAKPAAVQLLEGYQKFARIGAEAPDYVVAAAAAQQSGTVAANPEANDEAYLCPVTVGSQTLNLDFDTGSSDLWVFSTLLPSDEQGSHNLYDPSEANLEQGETWNITYGDQSSAAGTVYADTVVVGGVTATSQAVEAATSISSEFVQDTGNDGLLGLAFSSINTVQPDQATTFFDTVKDSLASALFTADLKKGEAGSYDFGYIDDSKYTGDITYVDVDNSQGFWGFTADGYAVGSGSTKGSIGAAIADTGTTLLYVPDAAVTAYYKQVSGAKNDNSQGGYVFDCDADLPDFIVSIGGADFTVPGSYINLASTGSGNTCFGGIQSNTGIGLTIFGDIFLKSQFVVFDQTTDSPRLGFAAQGS